MAELAIRVVHIDGVRTLVRETGTPDASEAVVFVHGHPGSSEDFDGLLSPVGEFARALAPDMPGFGQSQRAEAFEYTVSAFARHLDAILRQFGGIL